MEHAHLLFDQSPSAIILVDTETGKIRAANRVACKHFGYTQKEFRALTISNLEVSESPAQTRQHMRQMLAAGGDEFETRLRTKAGDVRDVRVAVRAVSLDGRDAFYGVVTDITAHREAERSLIASEQALRDAERIARVGHYVADFAGDSWTSSDELNRIFGIDDQYVRSVANWVAIVHPDWRATMAEYLATEVIVRQEPFDKEYKIVRVNDGAERWVYGRGVIDFDDQHRPRWLRGTIQDITERKEAEADRLLQSAALNAAANAIVITNRSGAILWVNAAFTALTGYEAAEVLGRNPRLLKSGKHDVAYYRELWDTILAGKTWHGRTTNRRKDGSLYIERQTIAPIPDSTGAVAHFIAVKDDITESVRLQQQLLQAQKMESIGRLAGGVAHDFNNLLSVILGWTTVAIDELPADHATRSTLEEVLSAAQRAAMLTKQLLQFSRQDVQTVTVFSVNDLVSEMRSMLQRVLGEDIEIVEHTDPSVGNVRMDRGQLEQVIINLAVNARHAMPTGGKLTIETSRVARRVVDMMAQEPPPEPHAIPSEYVMLSVADTGTGMSEEVRARVFEPFFTTKPVGQGTGLGLSTSHGIITQANGRLGLFSEVGRGTTVFIFLPHTALPARAVSQDQGAGAPRGTETILLVDDDDAVSRVTAQMLERHGYRVVHMNNGAAALAHIREAGEPLHLLVTDVVLGAGLDGPALAEHALAIDPELKVLFISGYAGDVASVHGLTETGHAFVQKPFTAEALCATVREVLDA